MSNLSAALLGGSGAMLGWGLSDFFAKRTIDEVGDVATLAWGQLVGCVLLAIGASASGKRLSYSAAHWLELAAFGVISGWSYLVLYRGFAKGQVSVLSPIFASYAGVAALGAAVAFGEHLPAFVIAGMPVIFIGILVMVADPADLRHSLRGPGAAAGVGDVLLAMLVFSGWLVLWDHFLRSRSWLPATLVMRGVAAVTVIAIAIASGRSLRVARRLWLPLAAVGACDVGAYSALSYGFSHSTLGSVVALLSGAFSLPTLVLARIFLKERLTARQGLAAAVIIGGVALVAAA
ncbi:MAG TPA: DMT family transporter [Mycobacteriales bacterium]|nr:DMT family transporter [Mycobacteriales bacterium]